MSEDNQEKGQAQPSGRDSPSFADPPARGHEGSPELAVESRPEELSELMAELDLGSSESILGFGARAQERVTELSDRMLEGVRAKDLGPVGASLGAMVSALRGLKVQGPEPGSRPGLVARLLGRGQPVLKLLRDYEAVRDQIEAISGDLERHRTKLMTDVAALDRLYTANLDYFRLLGRYIAAGEGTLAELDDRRVPDLAARVADGKDPMHAQELRDLRGARDDLERRIHDLKLTRHVAMQALPSIRLVQEGDKGLINKIGSTLVTTVPLWRQQLAQALTMHRSAQAAGAIESATELTNELLRTNAESLRSASAASRRQLERGSVDLEAVKRANQELIATIEEGLAIAEEGKRARAAASRELGQLEGDLKRALAAASPSASEGSWP